VENVLNLRCLHFPIFENYLVVCFINEQAKKDCNWATGLKTQAEATVLVFKGVKTNTVILVVVLRPVRNHS